MVSRVEPMSPQDAMFLHVENDVTPMHIGGVSIFEGPVPAFDELLARPLWEIWMVEGLDDGRWALLSKVHHCMVDGVAATDLMSVMFSENGGSDEPAWEPHPEPSGLELFVRGTSRRVLHSAEQARAARRLESSYPYVPIVGTIRIVVAIFSYDDALYFGVTGDRDHVADIGTLTEGIEAGLAALLERAAAVAA